MLHFLDRRSMNFAVSLLDVNIIHPHGNVVMNLYNRYGFIKGIHIETMK